MASAWKSTPPPRANNHASGRSANASRPQAAVPSTSLPRYATKADSTARQPRSAPGSDPAVTIAPSCSSSAAARGSNLASGPTCQERNKTEASHDQEIETVLDEFIGKITQPTLQRGPVLAVEHISRVPEQRNRPPAHDRLRPGRVVTASSTRPRSANQAAVLRRRSDDTVGPQLGHGVLEQHVAEHLVIAVPLLMAVQGADKQVVPFDPLDTLARASTRDLHSRSRLRTARRRNDPGSQFVTGTTPIAAGWRASTSSARYSANPASRPDRPAKRPSGSSASRSDRLANCKPAIQPSVRCSSSSMAVWLRGVRSACLQVPGSLVPCEPQVRVHEISVNCPFARSEARDRAGL